MINNHLVEIITTKVSVARGRQNFEDTIANLQNGHVKRAAPEVKNQNAFVALFVEAVGQRSRCGLVDDAQHLKASDLSGVLRGLPLGIIEVSRNRNHRLGDGFSQVFPSIFRQLAQHLSRHLFRGELLVEHRTLHFHVRAGFFDSVTHFLLFITHLVNPTPDEALHRIKRVGRIHHRLTFGDLADQLVLVLGVSNNGGCCAETLGVSDDGGLATLHHGNAAVRGAKVNADNFAHRSPSLKSDLNGDILIRTPHERRGGVPEQAGWGSDPATR